MAYTASAAGMHSNGGFWAALRARIVNYRDYRKTLVELNRLSVRELDDLGIAGADLDIIARHAVYGR